MLMRGRKKLAFVSSHRVFIVSTHRSEALVVHYGRSDPPVTHAASKWPSLVFTIRDTWMRV